MSKRDAARGRVWFKKYSLSCRDNLLLRLGSRALCAAARCSNLRNRRIVVGLRRSGDCPGIGFWSSESARRPAGSRPCRRFSSRCRPIPAWRSSSSRISRRDRKAPCRKSSPARRHCRSSRSHDGAAIEPNRAYVLASDAVPTLGAGPASPGAASGRRARAQQDRRVFRLARRGSRRRCGRGHPVRHRA